MAKKYKGYKGSGMNTSYHRKTLTTGGKKLARAISKVAMHKNFNRLGGDN